MALNIMDKSAHTDPGVYNARPHGAASIRGILLHATASPKDGGSIADAESGDLSWLSGGSLHVPDPRPVSTHYLVKRNGEVIRIVRDELRAWHAGFSMWKGIPDCNSWMIGIEFCNTNLGEAYTDAQYESGAQLVWMLRDKWQIADDCVASHRGVRNQWLAVHPGTAEIKTDPLEFKFDRMWTRVNELPDDIQQPGRFFHETGRTMEGDFLTFFEAHGDVAQFGYPISDVLSETIEGVTYRVQYTQRARFEHHQTGVMLGLVGTEVFVHKGGVPATATITSTDLKNFYDSHGGVNLLGLPISTEHVELLPVGDKPTPFTVQYCQRARLERHPESNKVMLGLVGSEAFALKH